MASRARYFAKRFFLTAFSLYVIVTILFLMFRLMPGDPATTFVDPSMNEETRNLIRQQFGLTEPLYIQYYLYMENLLRGDLGESFTMSESVAEIIFDRTLNTLLLMLTSILLAYLIGPIIGAYLAWNRGKSVDTYGIGLMLFMRGAPVFWTGMLAITIFSIQLGWFPTGGMSSPGYASESIFGTIADTLKHMALPVMVTTLYLISVPTFVMRNNMIDVLDEDFIRLCRAKGASEFSLIYKHAARNSLLPLVHYGAVALGFAFGGSVIIEVVFSWPGVGRTMFDAVVNRDYPLAQGAFLMLATVVVIMNFLADVVSVYIDPRVSIEE